MPHLAPPSLALLPSKSHFSHLPHIRTLHLTHTHIPSHAPTYTSYLHASRIQSALRRAHLLSKSDPSVEPPAPALLSFTPPPTYTLGRRQKELDEAQRARLAAPLHVRSLHDGKVQSFKPEIFQSLRGGKTTYHGPGQLVLWPIINLHPPTPTSTPPPYPPQTVRSYATHLETTTSTLLRKTFSLTTETHPAEPGLWIPPDRKIAALGVHLRRRISSLGLALNIDVPVSGTEAEALNPWARFVPCGIEDKGVTSLKEELGERWDRHPLLLPEDGSGRAVDVSERIARLWAEEFARGLGLEVVEEPIDSLLERLRVDFGTWGEEGPLDLED